MRRFFKLVEQIQDTEHRIQYPDENEYNDDLDEIDEFDDRFWGEKRYQSFEQIIVDEIEEQDHLCKPYIQVLSSLLESGEEFDINEKDYDEGETILIRITMTGRLDLVKALVEAGADVNAQSKDGGFALKYAAACGWLEIYDYLFPLTKPELRSYVELAGTLDKGLLYRQQRNDENYYRVEAFRSAAVYGNVRAVSEAIASGIDVNAINPGGSTALYNACWHRKMSVVRILLEAGADPNLKPDDGIGNTPLMECLHDDCIETFRMLIKAGADVNGKNNQDITVLIMAVSCPNIEAVRLLLEGGADVNAQNCIGDTALYWAIPDSTEEIVEILLEADAQVDTANDLSYSPLMLATYLNKTRIVEILQTAGASTAGLDRVELIQAIEQTAPQQVQALLARGTTPNAYHYQGNTALGLAIETGKLEICRLLIQAGADTEFVHWGQRQSALLNAVKRRKTEVIKLLIEGNVNLNLQGEEGGETALIEAVRYCNLDAVRLLVEAGADVTIRDRLGHAALYYVDCQGSQCSINDQTEMGMLLLDAGASYDEEHSEVSVEDAI